MTIVKQFLQALAQHQYEEATRHFERLQKTTFKHFQASHFGQEISKLRRLYKETNANEVLVFAEQLASMAVNAFPQQSFLTQQYGWVLYDRYMKPRDITVAQKIEIGERILQMTAQGTYSPFEATLWRLLPLYEQRSIEQAYALLQRLNRQALSRDTRKIMLHGQAVIQPSSREKYYCATIDYTWTLAQYKACYRACYEFLYTSGVTVQQKLPLFQKMVRCLVIEQREAEAMTFAQALAREKDAYAVLVTDVEQAMMQRKK